MKLENLILIDELCVHYDLKKDFFWALEVHGLLDIELKDSLAYLHESDIIKLERIIRLKDELELPIESLDVYFHLMDKIDDLQQEIRTLRNRLYYFNMV